MSRAPLCAALCLSTLLGWAAGKPAAVDGSGPVPATKEDWLLGIRKSSLAKQHGHDVEELGFCRGFSWPGCEPKTVCDNDFEELGCFSNGEKTPWCHMVDVPQKTSFIEPKFFLHSPSGSVQTINWFALTLSINALKDLDPSKELFIIIHGFGSGWPRDYEAPMIKALNALGHNALAVDWDKGSADPDYFQAASNTRIMGAVVAKVLEKLTLLKAFSPKRTTLVGFSLGAHVAGFAGARTRGLKRIIALDPAGPLYAKCDPFYLGMTPETRLNYTDAELVQCIHTDGLPLGSGGAGTITQFGHIDFYPNGGSIQPGCGKPAPIAVKDLTHMNWTAAFDALLCPHERSDWLFTTGLINAAKPNGCQFTAFPCTSQVEWAAGACTHCEQGGCPVAGIQTDLGTPHKGKFYFNTLGTNSSAGLYCGDQYEVLLMSDVFVWGTLDLNITAGNGLAGSQTIKMYAKSYEYLLTAEYGQQLSAMSIYYKAQTFFGAPKFRIISLEIRRLGHVEQGYRSFASTQVISGKTTIVPLLSYGGQ